MTGKDFKMITRPRKFDHTKEFIENLTIDISLQAGIEHDDPLLVFLVCGWVAGYETGIRAAVEVSRKNRLLEPGTVVFEQLKNDCLAVLSSVGRI